MKKKQYECKSCGTTNEESFYPGHKSNCKACLNAKKQEKWVNASQEYRDEYYQRNKALRSSDFEHMIRYRCDLAKNRSKQKGIVYEINPEMMMQKLKDQDFKCYISGVPLTHYEDLPNTVSFDRFVNEIGYTYENTFLVTSFINNAKASYGYDEFKKLMIEVCAYMDR